MKLLFRNKHNGRFLTPIEVLPNYVRMYHEASDRVFWYKKATLHEHLQVVHHDVRVGDVLRCDGNDYTWVVKSVGKEWITIDSTLVAGATINPATLVNYTRVGRNYTPKRTGFDLQMWVKVRCPVRDLLVHNRFEIGGRVFRNYFVARAWARHIGKPEGEIQCYTSSR